eukprot:Gregarina_sp_Poly_1__7001@NODE_380_length_9076_cov_204_162726_g313_i0_p2_GENE_NODE_380_length_9076_cov_204_162726_g313_i0NODE_380_length_9076_cov_204_162726_g313_i0_p2_ORF_typecomplete_len562_score78_97ANAPC4_WD40/PF12894_7/0_05ANAPC4_WD40/PF12894_7/89ANAPC4_WD40/PF12894_7/0_3ANAPC4_WD40/PF12894_7/0_0052Ubox/PF04564_15/1_2e05Ubox/PF04564_15/6_6e03WD40_like/PF17005_5/0_16WD40_like/PF17005_5/0_17Prp19/PF08606_11/9_8e05WD40/PF00400_32/0_24WD40/PF00400_32/7_9e03WD40/PF00400_32/9_6WD40/PF00400_32/8_1
MSLTCQLSGLVPSEPVVDKQGHLFEKRIIEEQLDKSARCPIDGHILEKKDLIFISQTPVRAPSAAYSDDLASLLKGIQDHYDNQAIECQRLRAERDDLRKTVAHNMYLRDAATTLLAKHMDRLEFLEKENTELRAQMDGESKRKRQKLETDDTMRTPSVNFASVLETWGELSKTLLQVRKKRVVQSTPLEELKSYQIKESQKCSIREATALSVIVSGRSSSSSKNVPHLIAIGGKSGSIEIRDIVQNKSLAVLNGHDSEVTSILSLVYPSVSHLPQSSLSVLGATSSSCHPFRSCVNLISADSNGQINIWRETSCKALDEIQWLVDHATPFGNEKCSHLENLPSTLNFSNQVVDIGKGCIKKIKLHPSGSHIGAVSSQLNGWSLVDIVHTGNVARTFEDAPTPIQDVAFQPDGLIVIGAGHDILPVWDLRLPRMKAQCKPPEGTSRYVYSSIDFSEAGYYMVTATTEGKGQLWDLRKSAVVQEYELSHKVHAARFDHSGMTVAFSTDAGVMLYSTREKKNLVLAAQWEEGMNMLDTRFDFLSDDYLVSLREDGMISVVGRP